MHHAPKSASFCEFQQDVHFDANNVSVRFEGDLDAFIKELIVEDSACQDFDVWAVL